MKKYHLITYLAVLAVTTMFLFSCGGGNKTTTATTVVVGFHFHTTLNGVPGEFNPGQGEQFYTDVAGRNEALLPPTQFYMTNIGIHLTNGAWQTFPGQVLLIRMQEREYVLGSIPLGSMDSIRFTVGLGNGLNSQSPSSFSTTSALDSVLSTNEQAAMWGSGMAGMANMASGYTFINFSGYDSTDHLPFSYQVGGYGDTVNIALGYAGGFNFVPPLYDGQVNLIHEYFDYGLLLHLAYPNLTNTNSTGSFYGTGQQQTNANYLLQFIPQVITWECTPPINC